MQLNKKQKRTINSACKYAVTEFARCNPTLIKQDSTLKPLFYSVAFIRIWKMHKKDKINWNAKNVIQFLKCQAKWAIQDEIRSSFIPVGRNEQKKYKLWECYSCGFKTNYHKHVLVEKKEEKCLCGASICWEFDPFNNPLTLVKRFSEIPKKNEIYGASYKEKNKIEIADEVEYFLKRIPEDYKRIIIERFFEEKSAEELAKIYKTTKNAIHLKTHAAINKCKDINRRRLAISR